MRTPDGKTGETERPSTDRQRSQERGYVRPTKKKRSRKRRQKKEKEDEE